MNEMLVMRNSLGGMIWQAYEVRNEKEKEILSNNARANGFCVETREIGYTEETFPGWRESEEWQCVLNGKLTPRAQGQAQVREILKSIRRDGPYWFGGYKDWLVSCFSLRDPSDLQGFTPIACWSELDGCCKQWMVCVKDGAYYVDRFYGSDRGRGYGLKCKRAEGQIYPTHIFDWIFHDVIPWHKTIDNSPSNV